MGHKRKLAMTVIALLFSTFLLPSFALASDNTNLALVAPSTNLISAQSTLAVQSTSWRRLDINESSVASLTSQNGDYKCMACCYAYADCIITGSRNTKDYFWNGSMAYDRKGQFEGRKLSSDQQTLRLLYDSINAGKCCILYVTEKCTNSTSEHWVLVVGYENVTSPDSLSLSNFLIIDPYSGSPRSVVNAAKPNGHTTQTLKYGSTTNNVRVAKTSVKTKGDDIDPYPNPMIIGDGAYSIHAAADTAYVLDVYDGSMSDQANVQLYTFGNGDNQNFKFSRNSDDGSYTIINVKSGKALDVQWNGKDDGTNVWQYTPNYAEAQRWFIEDAGNGFVRFRSKASNKYLDVDSAKMANEANVQIWSGHTGWAQKFKLERSCITISEGVYTIHAGANKAYSLDVSGGSMEDNANIAIFSFGCGDNQQFRFVKNSDFSYKIINVRSGKALDVEWNSTKDGANVCQYELKDVDNQRWFVEDAGAGLIRLRSKSSGKYLDVDSANMANSTNVQIWTGHGGVAQKFALNPYTEFGTRSTSLADGYYSIVPMCDEGYALENKGGIAANGNNIQLGKKSGNPSQAFHVVKHDSETYVISPKNSDSFALDVDGPSLDDGANVQLYENHAYMNQRWILRDCGNGWYAFQSLYSGKFLDVYGGVASDGANMAQWVGNNRTGQKFRLVPWDISAATLEGVSAKTYNGKPQTQSLNVKIDNISLKPDTDFVVSYKNNVNVGTATVTVTGKGNYTGTKSATFKINAANLSNAAITGLLDKTYTGKTQTQDPTVKLGGATLTSGTDYSVSYSDNVNVGTATVTIAGKGNYAGTKSATFKINAAPSSPTAPVSPSAPSKPAASKASLSKATITGLKAKTYTGKAIAQAPTVKLGSKTLKAGADYAVSYRDNVNAGTATITVTGKGAYAGSKSATFRIAKAANTMTAKAKSPSVKASKVKRANQSIAAKKAFSVSKAKGKVAYKKASGSKRIAVSASGKVTVKKGLKKGTYKVKVKVTAKGNANYKAGSKTVTVKVTVR